MKLSRKCSKIDEKLRLGGLGRHLAHKAAPGTPKSERIGCCFQQFLQKVTELMLRLGTLGPPVGLKIDPFSKKGSIFCKK